jgi:hypothetical protein
MQNWDRAGARELDLAHSLAVYRADSLLGNFYPCTPPFLGKLGLLYRYLRAEMAYRQNAILGILLGKWVPFRPIRHSIQYGIILGHS